MKKYAIYIIIVFLHISIPAESLEKRITIKECIKIALENHPDILVAIEDKKQSVADYKIAKAQSSVLVNGEIRTIEYPRKSSAIGQTVSIPGVGADIGIYAGLTAAYKIFDMKVSNQIKAARINMDLARFQDQKKRDDIIYNVKKNYYNYLMAKRTMLLREQLLKKNTDRRDLTKKLFNSGQRPILDVSKAEVDLAEASLEFERAKNSERSSKTMLFASMGISEEEIEIHPEDIFELPGLKYSIIELNKLAELYDTEVAIIKLQKKISKLQIDVAKSERWPKISVVFGLGSRNTGIRGFSDFEQNFQSQNWEVAATGYFTIQIPIYSGGSVTAQIESKISDYNKLIYQEREIMLKLENSLRTDVRVLEELSKQTDMSVLIIENSKKHLLLAKKSYENGLGSLLELQDAELTVLKAELASYEAKYNYMLTVAHLASTVGLGEDYLCK